MGETNEQEIRDAVQKRYAAAARQVKVQRRASCCSDSGCCDSHTPQLYDLSQLAEVPDNAALASLGCGNPTLLAELKPGETVLDLGSGGGIDVLLSARRVGPSGMAYGLDMTDEMLELARENATRAGVANVQFLKGEMESIPLPDASVDVIHLKLCHQPFGRQGQGAIRGVPGVEARRAFRGGGHGRPGRLPARLCQKGHVSLGWMYRRCPL